MQFDDILKEIGEFGPYQKRIYFLLCLPILFQATFDILNSYRMYTPQHVCAMIDVPVKNKEQSYKYPTSVFHNNSDDYEYGECRVTIGTNSSNTTSFVCSSWTYDQTVFTSTCVSKFNLVCDDQLTSAYIQAITNSGFMTASFFEGFISDRLGRKRTLCGSLTVAMLVGICAAFSPNIYIFTVLVFIQTLCSSFIYSSTFILGVELVGPSKRRWPGIIINFFYSTGIIMLSGIGYGFRDWKYIQIACSAPLAFFVIYWWIIPESPRWLISQGRFDEAATIIHTIAKYNKREDNLGFEQLFEKDRDEEHEHFNVCHLFSSRPILIRCVVIWTTWMTLYSTYYGFTLNAENLSGDFYLNHLLAGLVEFPANAAACLLLDKIGRKKLFILGMSVGGLCLLMTGVVEQFWPNETISVSFAMIGKSGLAVGYAVVYMWSAELFPTALRSTGMSIGNLFGEFGYIVVPYIIGQALRVPGYGRVLPLYLFAGLALGGSLCSLMLPDMTMERLPETLQIKQKRSSKDIDHRKNSGNAPTAELLLQTESLGQG